ncbi:MAG: pilus assembly protein PilM [Candidatus Omnitrophica bacterium]|nr:pilus assembly protein PilM [Candidatus Omnitrophota bacterium]MCM8826534.1 pilus assembly protein PilM [Candidatus Omnitrophota bacterium]
MEIAKKKDKKFSAKISSVEIISTVKDFFLATQCILGLDIGSHYIKIVQIRRSHDSYVVNNYRVRALPYQIKDNPKERSKFIVEFLREFISETRPKTSMGRIALWGSGAYIFSLSIPSVSEKDIRGVISIELKKKLPFQVDLSSIIFNFFLTDKVKDEKGFTSQITCLAMDKYALEESISIFKETGVRPIAVYLIPDVLGNLVRYMVGDTDYVSVLDMGSKESVLSFYRKGALQFSRQIPIGGEQFTSAIMKAMSNLGVDNLTYDNAEKIKRQCGIPLEEEVFLEYFTDFGVIKGNQIAVALRPLMERFYTELSRTINYYYRTFHTEKIECLYITGGGSRLKNIDKFLQSNLKNLGIVNIQLLNPLKIVKGWQDSAVFRHELVMEEASPHLSASIGLCINRGGRVNLLPPKEKLEQKVVFLATLTRVVFLLLLAIILSFYSFSFWKCLLYKKIITNTETEIAKLEPMVRKINEYLSMKRVLTERKALLEDAIGRQPLWWGILKELSNITPQGISLKRLEIKIQGGKKELHLIGEVFAEYTTIDLAISQYFVGLEESPFFTNVRPVSTERDIYSAVPKANFEIVCELVY